MKQLSGQDNAFLEIEEAGITQNIASVAIYDQSTAPDGIVRFKQIIELLESRLHLSPIFRSKLLHVPGGVDRPYLVDDPDFDMEYHVRHIALPQPGDWRQLCIQIARINSRPMDMRKPLWELYVIEGLDGVEGVPKGSFAILTRMHHSIMDGATASEFQAAIHDIEPKPRYVPPEKTRVIRQPPPAISLLGRAYLNALRKPQQFVSLASNTAKAFLPDLIKDLFNRDETTEQKVKTRFNGPLSPHRVLDALEFDFQEVREIKNTIEGATINDVVLSIVSGGLHNFLKQNGELPAESLTCGCPVDVRDESTRGTGGNVVGMMGVKLCTQIEDPMERFRTINQYSKEAKSSAKASSVRIPQEMMNTMPGGIMSMVLRVAATLGQIPYHTQLTNVPGPPIQLYFAGAAIVKGFGIGVLTPGMGLFHTCSSAVMNGQGKILLSFWADREMLPKPEEYKECIQRSYDDLRSAALAYKAEREKAAKAAPKKAPAKKAVKKKAAAVKQAS